ncbi:MAG: hypothetical protein AB2L14_32955 [Candidatus Xenobiia bacterium LiM19]
MMSIDENSYLCLRTLWKYRMMATKENIEDSVFQRITDRIKGHFKVDTDTQRIDSVHVVSNMKKLGRVRIFATTIKAFLTDIGRRFPSLSEEMIPQDIRERYLEKKNAGCFSTHSKKIGPFEEPYSEYHRSPLWWPQYALSGCCAFYVPEYASCRFDIDNVRVPFYHI